MSAPNIFGFRHYLRERVQKEDRGYATPCWIWRLAVKPDGYVVGKPPGFNKTVRISRVAYEVFVGPIPEGAEIDHLCRERACCNPDHLQAVTHVENMSRQVAARVSCRRGHPFDRQNLYVSPSGARTCRTCKAIGEKARPARDRERVAA